jgi:hypothetical protein
VLCVNVIVYFYVYKESMCALLYYKGLKLTVGVKIRRPLEDDQKNHFIADLFVGSTIFSIVAQYYREI